MGKYFVTGGGTGGHIYPAVAVADELRKTDEIYYIGNPKNLEYDIVSKKDYKFLPVSVRAMPRTLSLSLVKWTVQLFISILKCSVYILKYKPDAVFGTGGYVSAPALMAAKLFGIPYMMHDCDAYPGLVSRSLAPYAKCVSVAFECACNVLKNKNCIVNGNPIREEFKTLSQVDARKNLGLSDKITLCIMGGSQGARSINNAACGTLKRLFEDFDIQIIFQTGKKNYERVIEQLQRTYPDYEANKNLIIRPYFEDMVSVLKASDIAISRSGSLSIFEICASHVAPVYVPYPYAAQDHQRKNAKFMVERGAGLYIEDGEINPTIVYDTISELINNRDKLISIQDTALALAHFDGTEKIIQSLKEL